MGEDQESKSADRDAAIEREARMHRRFSLNDAIGQLAGGEFTKGGTPITRKRQAELELDEYLRRHLIDSGGVLKSVLSRHLGEPLLKRDYGRPLAVLQEYVQRVLASTPFLEEFVREADAEWGRVHEERPYFQVSGRPPHRDDPYTVDSVRVALLQLQESLASGAI